MAVTTSTDDFPEIKLVHTELSVTIVASFEIRDRSDANQVENDIEEALEALRRLGAVESISYGSSEVEE